MIFGGCVGSHGTPTLHGDLVTASLLDPVAARMMGGSTKKSKGEKSGAPWAQQPGSIDLSGILRKDLYLLPGYPKDLYHIYIFLESYENGFVFLWLSASAFRCSPMLPCSWAEEKKKKPKD